MYVCVYKWLNKTPIYKLDKFYFFNLCKKFIKNRSYQVFNFKKRLCKLERKYSHCYMGALHGL